jgi:hypothetical protein
MCGAGHQYEQHEQHEQHEQTKKQIYLFIVFSSRQIVG